MQQELKEKLNAIIDKHNFVSEDGAVKSHRSFVLAAMEEAYNLAMAEKAAPELKEVAEKETVEDAAEKYGTLYYKKEKPANTYTFHEGFKSGANWQKHQSNQEVIELIEKRIEYWKEKSPMYDLIIDELTDLLTQIRK